MDIGGYVVVGGPWTPWGAPLPPFAPGLLVVVVVMVGLVSSPSSSVVGTRVLVVEVGLVPVPVPVPVLVPVRVPVLVPVPVAVPVRTPPAPGSVWLVESASNVPNQLAPGFTHTEFWW